MEPTITRTKERQQVVLGGRSFEAAETVTLDFGNQGMTRIFIRDPAAGNPALLRGALRDMGYELIPPAGA